MSGFDSLTWALDGWFETSLCDLPDALRLRIERVFLALSWDQLCASDRRRQLGGLAVAVGWPAAV